MFQSFNNDEIYKWNDFVFKDKKTPYLHQMKSSKVPNDP